MTVQFMKIVCEIHGRYLTVGEMERRACSTCDPAPFLQHCSRCGSRLLDGGKCPVRHASAARRPQKDYAPEADMKTLTTLDMFR